MSVISCHFISLASKLSVVMVVEGCAPCMWLCVPQAR